MIPRVLIDTANIPGASGKDDVDTLRLIRRGDEFSIMLGSNELMNSRLSGSEQALATLACDRILPRAGANMLIGGLGMGFTLRAALAVLDSDAVIMVAELVPAVIEWAHGPMAAIYGDSLHDPRVTIVAADIVEMINAREPQYDAILLDVDNGPDGLTTSANYRLYGGKGLRAAYHKLRAGGVLAVWSAAPDKAFAQRLRDTGFIVDEIKVRAHRGRSGGHHIIWCAVKP